MKLFLNIKNNLNIKYLILFTILVIFLLLLSILETIGLSSIPVLISSIIKESSFIDNLNLTSNTSSQQCIYKSIIYHFL